MNEIATYSITLESAGAITEATVSLIQSNPAGLASSIMGVLGLASSNQHT